jgi:hypothetical protein
MWRLLVLGSLLTTACSICGWSQSADKCAAEREMRSGFFEGLENERLQEEHREDRRKACVAGDQVVCDELHLEEATPGDGRLETMCARGVVAGCLRSGGVTQLRRACELGDATGCQRAAEVELDPKRRLVFLERACAIDVEGCGPAALALWSAGELARARAAAERGCPHVHDACVVVGRLAVGRKP